MINVGWLAAGVLLKEVELHWLFIPERVHVAYLPANGKKSRAAEEIYQTLLTNRKPENIDQIQAINVVKPSMRRMNNEN
jgi:hypothetical protein